MADMHVAYCWKPFSNLCEKLLIRLLVKQTGSSKYLSEDELWGYHWWGESFILLSFFI